MPSFAWCVVALPITGSSVDSATRGIMVLPSSKGTCVQEEVVTFSASGNTGRRRIIGQSDVTLEDERAQGVSVLEKCMGSACLCGFHYVKDSGNESLHLLM